MMSFNPSQVGYKHTKDTPFHKRPYSFNPSQVGYKPIPLNFYIITLTCFNPSQVGYKQEYEINFYARLGKVSIPRRQATNTTFTTTQRTLEGVSIPRRQATNKFETPLRGCRRESFNPSQVGYKLIFFSFTKCNPTYVSIPRRQATNLRLRSDICSHPPVSIPRRQATNDSNSLVKLVKEQSFNPSQVGYKHSRCSLSGSSWFVSIPRRQATNELCLSVTV